MKHILTLTALLLAPLATLGGPPLDTFEQRKQWILETVTANPELHTGEKLAGRYTNRKGAVVERHFAGPAAIDGRPVDFDHWPLAESPWVHQSSKDSPLVVTHGKLTRTYDTATWRIEQRAE